MLKCQQVGILTFISRKNNILGLSEPEKCWISLYFHTYEHLKFHAQLNPEGIVWYGCAIFAQLSASELRFFTVVCMPQTLFMMPAKQKWTRIKGRRPSVPRCVKCQYVVNMSITCMLKKCHQRRWQIPSPPPLKAPPLIKRSMGLFKKPGILQNTYNI